MHAIGPPRSGGPVAASGRLSAMHTLTKTAAASVLAGVGAVAYGSLVERQAYALRRFVLPVLPSGARPIDVLHLSDVHLLPDQRRKRAWISALAELEPDAVINTGDNIAHPSSVPSGRTA